MCVPDFRGPLGRGPHKSSSTAKSILCTLSVLTYDNPERSSESSYSRRVASRRCSSLSTNVHRKPPMPRSRFQPTPKNAGESGKRAASAAHRPRALTVVRDAEGCDARDALCDHQATRSTLSDKVNLRGSAQEALFFAGSGDGHPHHQLPGAEHADQQDGERDDCQAVEGDCVAFEKGHAGDTE
jgi:hypothetical protein